MSKFVLDFIEVKLTHIGPNYLCDCDYDKFCSNQLVAAGLMPRDYLLFAFIYFILHSTTPCISFQSVSELFKDYKNSITFRVIFVEVGPLCSQNIYIFF